MPLAMAFSSVIGLAVAAGANRSPMVDLPLSSSTTTVAEGGINGVKMTVIGIDVPNNILAPLIVALLLAVFGLAWVAATAHFRKKVAAAPEAYVSELDKLIQTGVAEGEQKAVVNARAIVAARNGLRDSMVTIGTSLNSEIDRLADDIGESKGLWEKVTAPIVDGPQATSDQPSRRRPASGKEAQAAAWETIQVLQRVWPAKKVQIKVEIRKVLAELGLSTN